PLDEANIGRFVRILKRFVQQSQFIIVTHNKQTIATADVLYGVTMEEQGVSKVVSLKFTKHGESANNEPQESFNGVTGNGSVNGTKELVQAGRGEAEELAVAS
ncbi:MAG: hypothetical protein N3G20_05750, partial [Verrucomicrobiae bacterium]|nr:hypothetical protein [Verrucomicrobiae bacterium]